MGPEYLIDTHILIWILNSPEKIPSDSFKILANPDNKIYFSPVNLSEIAIKISINKLHVNTMPKTIYNTLLKDGLLYLPFGPEETNYLAQLPLHHRDPFDRMLIAQAQAQNMAFISQDKKFPSYDIKLVQ